MNTKTVLITGASSGIGKIIADHLNGVGYEVYGTSRKAVSTADNQPATAGLLAQSSTCTVPLLTLDVTSDASVEQLMQVLEEKKIKVDVLINNAGVGLAGPLENFTIEEAREQFETNFFGVVRMVNAFLPLMRKQGGGLIINIGSMAGLIGLPFQGHYSASKYALEGYLSALRMEVLPFNIKVFNINPGDFRTGFTANRRIIKKVDPVYQTKFNQLLKMYEHDENNGADPLLIAKKIEKLLFKVGGFKQRYVVGKFDQVIGVPLKRLLGDTLFEKVMMLFWKIKD
jgi:short-subunit dehydrogenase